MLLRYLHSSASCFPNSRLEHAVIELAGAVACAQHIISPHLQPPEATNS